MRVSWKTNATAPSVCNYGPGSTLTSTANGSSVNYIPGGGFHHTVKLADLLPSTSYSYSCGGSAPNSFTTVAPAASSAPVSALIFADWGYLDSVARPSIPIGGVYTNWSASLTRTLIDSQSGSVNFTWLVGDISYSDDAFVHYGHLLTFGYEDCYDGFMQWVEPFASTAPLMVSPGNHESECHSPYCILDLPTGLLLKNFTAYNARWAMPAPETAPVAGVLNMWYSWDVGNVHFVSIDTSTDFPGAPEGETGDSHFPLFTAGSFGRPGEYLAWLNADLAGARANPNTDWIVAGGHRPFEDFNSSAHVALFKEYAVDLYVAGHGHSYLRYTADQWGDGTAHIMAGGAGCDEMPWPADQMTATVEEAGMAPMEACRSWCERAAVRQAFAAGVAAREVDAQRGPSAYESAWAPAEAQGGDGATLPPANDPCHYCTGAVAYQSDNMAIGRLDVDGDTLTWTLLRAPDGLVLDTLVLHRNTTR